MQASARHPKPRTRRVHRRGFYFVSVGAEAMARLTFLERKSLAGQGEAKVLRRYEKVRCGFNKSAHSHCHRSRLLKAIVKYLLDRERL